MSKNAWLRAAAGRDDTATRTRAFCLVHLFCASVITRHTASVSHGANNNKRVA